MTGEQSPDVSTRRVIERLAVVLLARGARLATAESCTGGGVAHRLTAVAGSSRWFDRGFITYSNEAKRDLLGVADSTLSVFGAVSEAVVREMVAGALVRSAATLAVAVTGIAGPAGGTPEKPVGTVWLAWQWRGGPTVVRREHLPGSRAVVRTAAVQRAITGLLAFVEQLR